MATIVDELRSAVEDLKALYARNKALEDQLQQVDSVVSDIKGITDDLRKQVEVKEAVRVTSPGPVSDVTAATEGPQRYVTGGLSMGGPTEGPQEEPTDTPTEEASQDTEVVTTTDPPTDPTAPPGPVSNPEETVPPTTEELAATVATLEQEVAKQHPEVTEPPAPPTQGTDAS